MRVVETILESSARLHKNARESGVVHRTIHAEVPPRVDYGLTDLGTECCLCWTVCTPGDKPQSKM